ncbi:hypothetical protein F6T96_001623 [Enterobacter hormaechei]|nr:hypothetical protein [Enterobacter hormaechei]
MITKRSEPRFSVILLIFVCLIGAYSFNSHLKPHAGQKGVAYISYKRILRESSLLAQEKKQNDTLLALAKKSSLEVEKKYYALPEPLRHKMKVIDELSKNTQLRAEQGRLRHISQQVISDTVEQYRINHHYSVVFNKDSASAMDHGHDISNEIINELQHVNVEYGPHPHFEDVTLGLLRAHPVSAG